MVSSQSLAYVSNELRIDSTTTITVNHLPVDYKEKYSGDDFNYDFEDGGPSWLERFVNWLVQTLSKIFNFEATQKGMKITTYVIKILYFVALASLIFFIARAIWRKEGYWIFNKKQHSVEIVSDNIETELREANFDELIKNAVKNSNFNLATRYYYLKTLKVLNEKGLIERDADKTNSDYIYEIKNSQLRKDFQYISYIYNYSWYGEFELNQEAWQQAETGFESFLKSVMR